MSTYNERRRNADQYLPQQRIILADIFNCNCTDITESTKDDDIKGIDMWIYKSIGIALRLRSYGFMNDQTIRLKPDMKGKTELDKLKENTDQDYILQAQKSNQNPQWIDKWRLLDIEPLRYALNDLSAVKAEVKQGPDYHFLAINMDNLVSKTDNLIKAFGCVEKTTTRDLEGNILSQVRTVYPHSQFPFDSDPEKQFIIEASAKRFK